MSKDKAGRDTTGKFLPGNAGGPGNPHAAKVGKLRATMLASVTTKDIKALTQKLMAMALDGDLKAAELLLSRLLGKPASDAQGTTVAIQNNVGGQESLDSKIERTMNIIRRVQSGRGDGDGLDEDGSS